MKIVDLSISRPVAVFISAVAAVVFGAVAFRQLATDLLPDVTYPSLTVRTSLPGAAPLEVESLITRPIENAVGVVNNLVRIASSSRAGVSEVVLEFGWGTEMDFAALAVRERLDVIVLPTDAEPPLLLRYDPSLDPILRVAISGSDDLIHLRRVAEERVKRPLERLEGVAAAVVQGGLEEEVLVEIDGQKIASLGISTAQLVERLAQENVNLTGGRLREGQTEFLVRTLNEILRPEDLAEIVVVAADGALIRFRDVAKISRDHREREIVSRLDGRESVEVAVFKAGGTNTVNVSSWVREALAGVEDSLRKIDPRLEVTVITDQARYIRQSVREVLDTAVQGGLLAILVLFLFLRSWRATAIIGLAIPVSVVATFFLMYAGGISLNIMSLGGLTLGIGMLVDNAIVVLEAIERRRGEGLGLVEAARAGGNEVSMAIVASTLTSVCVFLPIVFVEGVAAQFFTDQALTVTFSLGISLVVALTLIPMLASRTFAPEPLAPGEQAASRGGPIFAASVFVVRAVKVFFAAIARLVGLVFDPAARLFQAGYDRLAGAYRRLLDQALARPIATVAIAALLFAGSLFLFPLLGQELVPELVQGEFTVDVELPPGTHLDVTQRRLAALERTAKSLPDVATVYTLVGTSSQQGGSAAETRENRGQLTVTVEPPISREKEDRLMEALRQAFAADQELDLRFGRPSYFSFKTPIELEIQGFNLRQLRRIADEAAAGLAAMPGLTDVESSAEGGAPELQVRFDRNRLASLGLSLEEVASVVQAKVQGTVATEIQQGDRTIDIRVRAAEGARNSSQDVRQMVVAERNRTPIPLSAVAEVVETEGPAEIRRANNERMAVLTANLVGRDLASASADIEALMASLDLPANFDWRLGGQRREMQASFDSMRLALFLAIFLVYLVMASQFESLLHPFVILFSIPLSLIGVLVVLAAFGVTLSVVVLIGVVMLAGVVVNNAILLLDATNRLRQEGLAKLEALREAGAQRLRPILMTTGTTVLGLLPMALGLGEGSELRAPMALTVIGGLTSSTLLTLVVIPVVYSLLDRKA